MGFDAHSELRISPEGKPKRILYCAPTDLQFRRWMADVTRIPGCEVIGERYPPLTYYRGVSMRWVQEITPQGAMERLGSFYANILLLDLRWAPEPDRPSAGITQARELLHLLDQVDDLEARYGFHRIVALVSGRNDTEIDQLMVELGGYGIQHVIRQRSTHEDQIPTEDEAIQFAQQVLDHTTDLLEAPRRRRTALCLAGGGITGIYYELGALKCLDDCLVQEPGEIPRINDFDMYFGISAGAVNSGILTAGYSVEEFMAAVAGIEGGRIPYFDLNLLQFQHLDIRGMRRRIQALLRSTWKTLRRAAAGDKRPHLDEVLIRYSDLLGPPFHGRRYEQILARLLTVNGATNDFRKLPRSLYIGASDHDLKRHVLFGSESQQDVPISKAIQASLSIHPVFSPAKIQGRYYEDGAVTRTSNFFEAIRRGASLVFVFDPFLPHVSQDAGYNDSRGILYNIDQEIRTLSYTRYENIRNWVLRKHPDVSSYTFVPSNRLRHLLSYNPMDHRTYMEIWKGAYLSTFRRIQKLHHRMKGDLEAHNIEMDLDRAREVRDRLQSSKKTTLNDFFPDGKIEIRQPPLAQHQPQQHYESPSSVMLSAWKEE